MTPNEINIKSTAARSNNNLDTHDHRVEENIVKILAILDQSAALDQETGAKYDSDPLSFDIQEMTSRLEAFSTGGKNDRRLMRAQAYLAKLGGNLESAEEILRHALEESPDDADLLHDLVLNLKDQKRLEEAEDLCTHASQRHPNLTTLLIDMAAVLSARGDLETACTHAQRAVNTSPDSAATWASLGNLRFLNRQFEQAEHAYNMCIHIAPADPIGPFMLGLTLSIIHRNSEAADAYRETKRLIGKKTGSLSAIANHIKVRFTGDSAIHSCALFFNFQDDKKDLIQVKKVPNILYFQVDALILAGRLEEAVQAATELIGQAPMDEWSHYHLGIALYLQKQYTLAIAPFSKAAFLNQRDVRPDFMRASCLWHQGKFDEAASVCARGMVSFAQKVPRPESVNLADIGDQGKTRVTLPWNMRMYMFSGMFHPLINEVTQTGYDGISLEYPGPRQSAAELRQSCLQVLKHFASTQVWLEEKCPEVSCGQVFAFMESRHFLSQVLAEHPAHQFTVLHTAPYTLNQTPWLLHLEVPLTVFYPFIAYGLTWNLKIEETPYYSLVKAYIESDQCLGIFSHLKSTCAALPRLFHNPSLAKKVHYYPLSAPALECSQKPKPSETAGPIRILFTSSFNNDSMSFYSRGGLYVVKAFLSLAEEYPDLELVLRVKLPKSLEIDLRDRILRHPRIKLVTKWLSEAELQALFDSADILGIPSYTLHCMSLFRAMASGCCCVVSDAPDYQQFVKGGENCLIAAGRLGKTYRVDSELGFVRENYPNMRLFDRTYATSVTATFRQLLADRYLLRRLQTNSRQFIQTEFPKSQSMATFGELLKIARAKRTTQPEVQVSD